MNWDITCFPDVGIISSVVSGRVTSEGICKLLIELLEMSKQTGAKRFICDNRGVSLDMSVHEVHQMPKTLLKLGLTNSEKVAIVYSANSSYTHYFTFFDTMCLISPLIIKTFTNYDEASRWLETSV